MLHFFVVDYINFIGICNFFKIRESQSDVAVLDAGDVYRAGWSYGLVPIMAEVYNLDTPHYYAVAVTKQRDNSSELIYLKRKNTCHTGVMQAAGWVVPMAWLIANERVGFLLKNPYN